MRGCAILLLSLLALPASPQCTFAPVASAPYRASYLDVVVDGNDLWAATSYGVQLLDRRTDPPTPTATIAVPGVTRVVRLGSGVVYAASGSGIAAIRRNGGTLQLTGNAGAGAQVNDLVVTPNYLYAATSNGLQQYDLLNPDVPARTAATFLTSTQNVTSLALAGATLYAADGDASVEVFNITLPTLPQRIGGINALARSTSVRASGNRLYVSDGLQTQLFIGSGASMTSVGTVQFGTTSLVPLTGDVVFVAGADRRLHALDWTVAGTPAELYATELAPTGGTINRYAALQLSGNRLYGAGGDVGLLTYDVGSFTAPYPLRHHPLGGFTSLAGMNGRLYGGRTSTGILEINQSSTGHLTAARQWDSATSTVHDGANNFLLTSTGATLSLWATSSSSPALVRSATLRMPIQSAVLIGTVAHAVLTDKSFWTVDLGAGSAPQQVTIAGFQPLRIARSGNATILAEIRENEGTTRTAYFSSANYAASPQFATIPGATTGGVTLAGTTAAVFTFRGVNLIDVLSGNVTVLPASNVGVARQLAISGSTLFQLNEETLRIYDLASRTFTRELPLPSLAVSMYVPETDPLGIASIVTGDGAMTVLYRAGSKTPTLFPVANGNAYYKKSLAANDRLYLFDGRAVDVFSTRFGRVPHYRGSARPLGVIDVAASAAGLFALSSTGVVSSFGPDGDPVAQTTINEGNDVLPLGILTAGNGVWVSIAKGCLTGVCEKKTLVYDPKTLAQTATMTGAAVDVTTSGNRAYVLAELPNEVRVVDITNPLHPSVVASKTSEGALPPVSIAYASGTLYVLGEKLYLHSESGLAKTGERLSSFVPESGSAYVDQRIRISGNCATVTGRAGAAQFFTLPQWTAAGSLPLPGFAKSLSLDGSRLFVMTDYSIEVLSNGTATPPPARRRGTD